MQQAKFEAQKRSVFGKGAARALRRTGHIPAVLYGRQKEVISLQLDERVFHRFLRSHGENVLIDLEIANQDVEIVMVKEIQRDPVNYQLLHTDFIRISLEEPVTSAVPLILIGSAPGVQEGGIVEFPHRQLAIRCLPTRFPDEVEVDISNLEIGDIVYVSNLSLAEDIEVVDDPTTRIVSVTPPRVIEEEGEEITEGIEAEAGEIGDTEPEVISRSRDDEE